MKAAIFDLDGTLFDSMWVWEKLAYEYLLSKRINPPDNIRETLKEYSLMEGSKVLKEMFDLQETSEEINREMEEILKDYYENKIQLKEGASDFLEQLYSEGVRMCAATATADHLAKAAMQRLGIAKYFDFLQTCKNVGMEKYQTEFYKLLIERLETKPEHIWVFEDALHSMEAAKACGLNIIAILDASAISDREKILEISDKAIENFTELNIQQ